MANLKVNAEFDTAMEQLTPETRAHADRFNERYEQLLGNDAFLKGKLEDANTNIERAMAVAQGKSAGYVFNTYSELIAYIAVPANVEKFRLGDQFLIKATDVPDYWWDNTVTTAQTDSAGNVISGKNTSGKIVGALVELEARKIDLSKYDANDAALFNNMSDQYSSARAYDVGDICIHNNDLYKCVTAVEAAETFNASKWNKTSLAALHAEQEKKISENTRSLTNKNRATTICRLNTTIYDEDSQDLYMEFTCEQNPNDFNLFTAIVSGAYIQTPVYIPEWYSETENCINISASRTVPADKHYYNYFYAMITWERNQTAPYKIKVRRARQFFMTSTDGVSVEKTGFDGNLFIAALQGIK